MLASFTRGTGAIGLGAPLLILWGVAVACGRLRLVSVYVRSPVVKLSSRGSPLGSLY
jgi:hypothetical protein